jgi:hypothetical protein
MEEFMPTETLIVLAGVLGAFAFFTVSLVFADLTWKGAKK